MFRPRTPDGVGDGLEPLRDRWQLAEARTDRMLGKHFAVLDEVERKELVDLLGATNR
jgi:hypothetical protein